MNTDETSHELVLSPVDSKRVPEVIYEKLRYMIVSGQLKPGDRLPSERRMMEMLQRSRPTIREALRMLERAGLIRTVQGSGGAIVCEPDTVSVGQPLENLVALGRISRAELLEYRRLNDVTFAGWAAERHSEEDIKSMAENLLEMERVIDDTDAFIACDVEFHSLIAAAGKNGFAVIVSGVIEKVMSDTLHCEFSSVASKHARELRNEVLKHHRSIFKAIKNGDANGARAAVEKHMLGFENDFGK